jgi:hypothetical protein
MNHYSCIHPQEQREHQNDDIAEFIKNQEQPSMSITSKVITVTPADAHRYLSNMVNNRPQSQFAISAYVSEMLSGRWAVTGQGLIFDPAGRLLDGQHRLLAVIKSNVTIKTTATYGIDPGTFSLMDGMHKRTASDVLGCKNATSTAAGLKLIYQELNGGYNSKTKAMRPRDAVTLLDQFPAIQDSASAIAGNSKLTKILPPGQAVYCHFRAGIDDASRRESFFAMLSSGAGLSSRSPVLALRSVLAPLALHFASRNLSAHGICI